ncbi:MAG TPA: DNA methyltransferase [Gammaproteobacteria bacterium]|nr:DNA methyltransferase [Gammaproteobacteria bacterium]
MELLPTLTDNSIDAVVCDPPYGLGKPPDMSKVLRAWLDGEAHKADGGGFMGQAWDSFVPGPEVWRECLRVLKPGGHLLAFFGSRTYDLGTLAIRLAGFEIRDQIMWLYGSGFPKSLNVGKAIDAKLSQGGSRPEDIRRAAMGEDYAPSGRGRANYGNGGGSKMNGAVGEVSAEAARQWAGYGTALKPAHEPIAVARKPLAGNVAENVLAHGVGGLNIDGCRIPIDEQLPGYKTHGNGQVGSGGVYEGGYRNEPNVIDTPHHDSARHNALGRWPANVCHDGSDEVLAAFPDAKGQQGALTGQESSSKTSACYGDFKERRVFPMRGDAGSAARFFYCGKATKAERDAGLAGAPKRPLAYSNQARAEAARGNAVEAKEGEFNVARLRANNHPTVKPVALMRWLVRLVTPPGGTVLDPYLGSGSTGIASALEGFEFIGIEREAEYIDIARARIAHFSMTPPDGEEPAAAAAPRASLEQVDLF